jgi:sporulation protein YlmC with PRC-barrel domain
MKRLILLGSGAACIYLGVVVPLRAAPAPINDPPPGVKALSASKPAGGCQSDVYALNKEMQKGGYWLGGSSYEYGYPMGGIGYGQGFGFAGGDMPGYRNARPGYEIRILLASANILAEKGQQQACEAVLDTTRAVYKTYVADMHGGGIRAVNEPDWQQKEIAAAQPVSAAGHSSYRSDELLDTSVRSPKNEVLGSVQDLVMDPKTGKIAYLVIARGGIFGFDKKYVPVPWDDFKATQGVSFLVLDTDKATMEGAPQVTHDQVLTSAQFEKRSQEVDAYWKTHLTN